MTISSNLAPNNFIIISMTVNSKAEINLMIYCSCILGITVAKTHLYYFLMIFDEAMVDILKRQVKLDARI